MQQETQIHCIWVLTGQLWCVFRSCQLPGLALKALPNSRANFHPHTFPAFVILPGQGEVWESWGMQLNCLQQILLLIRHGGVSRHFPMTIPAKNIELSYNDSAHGKPGLQKFPRKSGCSTCLSPARTGNHRQPGIFGASLWGRWAGGSEEGALSLREERLVLKVCVSPSLPWLLI